MNINIENEIRDAIANGAEIDDVGTDIAKLLNQLQKEKNEKAQKQSAMDEFYDKCCDEVENARHGILTPSCVGAMAVIVHAPKYNWTFEEAKAFYDSMTKSVENTARYVNMDPGEALADLLHTIFNPVEEKAAKVKPKAEKKFDELENKFRDFIDKL